VSAYGPDYDAAMAGARLQWDRLSPTMQRALSEAATSANYPTRRVDGVWSKSTVLALVRRDLTGAFGQWGLLTPMGLLVREAGLAAKRERAERGEA
jgi:hypothetical protein